jgi:hypothetical protein
LFLTRLGALYKLVTGKSIGASRWIEGQGITIDKSDNNKSQAYTYAKDSQGNKLGLVQVNDDKSRPEAWYLDTVKAGKPT